MERTKMETRSAPTRKKNGAGRNGSSNGNGHAKEPGASKSRAANGAEAAAKRRLAEYEAILATLDRSHVSVELDPSGAILGANEGFLRLMGRSMAELRGQHHGTLLEPSYLASDEYRQLWTALGEGKHQQVEQRCVGPSGREVYLHASYNPLVDRNGRTTKVLVFATDVTAARSRLAGELAELKTRIAIMDRTSLISETDLRGRITAINDKFCEVSQFDRDELIGQPHNIVRHPDSPKEVFKELWATIGRGNIFRAVIKNKKKDGSPYYVDAVIAPVLGENGKPKSYIGVRYDITDLELERQNMRGIVNALDSAYAYAEFDAEGVVQSANKNFLQIMGYANEQIVGKHHRTFVDPAQAASPEYAELWTGLKAGRHKSDIFKRVAKDGRTVWLQAAYSPVTDEKGVVRKVVQIATDVTDRINAQERERAMAEQMRRLLLEISQHAEGLSNASQELSAVSTQLASSA